MILIDQNCSKARFYLKDFIVFEIEKKEKRKKINARSDFQMFKMRA